MGVTGAYNDNAMSDLVTIAHVNPALQDESPNLETAGHPDRKVGLFLVPAASETWMKGSFSTATSPRSDDLS